LLNVIKQHLKDGTPLDIIYKECSRIDSETSLDQVSKCIATSIGAKTSSVRKDIQKYEIPNDFKSQEAEVETFTQAELSEAKLLLKNPDFLQEVVNLTNDSGFIGEEVNKKILYLACTSRFFDDDSISCVVKGSSSTGKSSLVSHILELFPKETTKKFSMMTPKALVHYKQDLSHNILFIQEREGAVDSDYSLRTIISEKEISISLPIKNEKTGDFETIEKKIDAKGLVYIETTTKDRIHAENETRVLDLYMDESPDQTRKVLLAAAETAKTGKKNLEDKIKIFRAAQSILSPYKVIIPYSKELAFYFPNDKPRARRDFKKTIKFNKSPCPY